MDFDALETLEKRVEALETKITSKTPLDQMNVHKVKPVLDSLHEVDTVLLSTLSGREKITSLLRNVKQLEKILDPSYLETKYNLDMKVEDILESETDLKYFSDNTAHLEKLEPALNGEISNTTVPPEKLLKMMSELSSIRKECQEQTVEFQKILKEYQEAIMYVSNLFIELETCITELEIRSQSENPKK